MIQPFIKGHDISVMVWAGFSVLGGRSDLCFPKGDANSPRGGVS